MARIKVSPEQIRHMGANFQSAGHQSQDLVRSLLGEVTSMSGDWEGITKERFYSDFAQWQLAMRDFCEMLQQISQELEVIAQRFEQADQA